MRSRTSTMLLCALALLALPYAARALSVEITATVPGCGDGVIGQGEQCEGSNLGGATCASLGYLGGTLGCTIACTYDVTNCSKPNTGGGGGGGSMNPASVAANTAVVVTGVAYPNAPVELLKDGQIVSVTSADANGKYQLGVSGLSAGDYQFAVHAIPPQEDVPQLVPVPITVTPGATTKIGEVIVPPEVTAAPTVAKVGDTVTVSGVAQAGAKVSLFVDGVASGSTISNADGTYTVMFTARDYEEETHIVQVRSDDHGYLSPLSRIVPIKVYAGGAKPAAPGDINGGGGSGSCRRADLNCDGRVDIVDLSIMLYWYKRSGSPVKIDLDGDGVISIRDFSILAYYWTG